MISGEEDNSAESSNNLDNNNADTNEIQPSKRPRKNCERPARVRNQVDRLGIQEINDDERFTALASAVTTTGSTIIIETETVPIEVVDENACVRNGETEQENTDSTAVLTTSMSPGEKVIFKILVDLAADIKVLKSHIVSCDSTTSKKEIKRGIRPIESSILVGIGLPLKKSEDLGRFNFNLLKEEFRTETVSVHVYIYNSIYYSL